MARSFLRSFRRPLTELTLLSIGWAIASVSQTMAGDSLSGTEVLTAQGDLAAKMVAGIDRFLLRETTAAGARRERFWNHPAVEGSADRDEAVRPNREHLAHLIGATDDRVSFDAPELVGTLDRSPLVAQTDRYEVYAVRWPVLRGREGGIVHGEGLLVVPKAKPPRADIVAIPDADCTPEMLLGLTVGVEPAAQFARRLAEMGCRVLVPVLIDRSDKHSIVGGTRKTNQPHREFIYRMAYEMGRHIIGYEVDKIRAAVDWFQQDADTDSTTIGVFGYGEGGLLALYAAALDTRIKVACVSGYFNNRDGLWQEPIYRNVFGLLREFGDAELASLVAPRTLIVEASRFPKVDGPPPVRDGRSGAAPGRLKTPTLESVETELNRARILVGDGLSQSLNVIASGGGNALPGSSKALIAFISSLAGNDFGHITTEGTSPEVNQREFGEAQRLKRQFDEIVAYTQDQMRESEYVRREFWSQADATSIDTWKASTAAYRQTFYEDVIGKFDCPRLPLRTHTRKVYDTPKFIGYEVMLDVFDDVFAYGILLVPKDIKKGQRRPLVVCQHGLEGRPSDVADPEFEHPAYHRYACQLAERGFITYAPQNPYIGRDKFRTLQRKANPLGKTLFSVIIPQHQATIEWLASLPYVDPQRIAFYGLSYGGKSAMRIPAVVEEYCLSICSADFDQWIWKNCSSRAARYSYMGTGEYEMVEFNLGRTFNYAEMAALIAPRPFMVERGHQDGVAPDERVAYEYAKVRHLFARLGIPERTRIEFFDGPHMINGVGTFAFLHQHLDWPRR